MASTIRPVRHEDRLSLVEHLDELRTRLIISGIALAVAFGLCAWQNSRLLSIINRPLSKVTQHQVSSGRGPLGQTAVAQQAVRALDAQVQQLLRVVGSPGSGLSTRARAALPPIAAQVRAAIARVPRTPEGNKPVTLGVGEPFATTLTIAFYFSAILALPVILYQLYAFLLPAFSPRERRVALPLMLMIPVLFVIGVVFGYFVVLPPAVRFLQNFNSGQFNVLVQAKDYYRFASLLLLAMGLIFQVPVAILAATRMGIVTPQQLRAGRRYAIVAAAVIAALLPADIFTMVLEMLPLIVLYELSILLAALVNRRELARERSESPPPPPSADAV